jgi:hypothetical protein
VTLWRQPWDAAIGWLDLIAGRREGIARFSATPTGLIVAVATLVIVMAAVVAIQSAIRSAAPVAAQLGAALLAEALPLVGLWGAIWGSATYLQSSVPLNALLVPATYALAFCTLLGLPVALAAGLGAVNLVLVALGLMLYREGRLIAGFGIGVSVAFTTICIVLLVALPIGFYMLSG